MARYIVRVRYSQKDEIEPGKHFILFERYHRDKKSWFIMQQFELEFCQGINQYIMPVDVLNYIKKLNDLNFELYYDYVTKPGFEN